MAGDWIKVRTSLPTNPKVIAMCDFLSGDFRFADWLLRPALWHRRIDLPLPGIKADGDGGDDAASSLVTELALRYVTVGGLVVVWSAAREHSTGGFLPGITVNGIDAISGIPSFGAAMEYVGWASYREGDGGTTLPEFYTYNDSPTKDPMTGAERQRRYRERKRGRDETVTRSDAGDGRGEVEESERREEVAAAVGGTDSSKSGEVPNGYTQSARAIQEEGVAEALSRMARFLSGSKHDAASVAELKAWISGLGKQAEKAVVALIAWAKDREDPAGSIFHAVHHGYAPEKAGLSKTERTEA